MDRDSLRLIFLEMDLPEIFIVCTRDKNINEKICNSNDFWREKFYKDYPKYKNAEFPYDTDFKHIYKNIKNITKYYIPFVYNNGAEYFDFIKKTEMDNDDVDLIKEIYDIPEKAIIKETSFYINGDFPDGTIAYYILTSDRAFLIKEEAIEYIIDKYLIKIMENDYYKIGKNAFRNTYKVDTIEEAIKEAKEKLFTTEEYHLPAITFPIYRSPVNFTIMPITLDS